MRSRVSERDWFVRGMTNVMEVGLAHHIRSDGTEACNPLIPATPSSVCFPFSVSGTSRSRTQCKMGSRVTHMCYCTNKTEQKSVPFLVIEMKTKFYSRTYQQLLDIVIDLEHSCGLDKSTRVSQLV
ncbi:hypothetical protein V6N13_111740 [Hibiscus sabdariffa]|uniref:Uncharacterized protein n=1 Tax=Hibiscus sabdariffa TaxID=183260 RepID=A0ABR2TLG9_9ROSI